MTFTTRLCVFAAIAVAGVIAWQWHVSSDNSHDVTQLAVQQFQNDGAVAVKLQEAAHAQNWWPFVWPALLVLLGVVMFWEDVERRWFREQE
jgi:hypothetical protein